MQEALSSSPSCSSVTPVGELQKKRGKIKNKKLGFLCANIRSFSLFSLFLEDFELPNRISRPTSFKIHGNRGIFLWILHSSEAFRSQTLPLIQDLKGKLVIVLLPLSIC